MPTTTQAVERIGVRELRRNLKAHLTAEEPRAVTSHGYNIAAFLIQVPKHSIWAQGQKKKALRACLKTAVRAIRAEIANA